MKHIKKPNFKSFLCMFCATLALGACSYFQPKEKPPEVEAANLMNGGIQPEPVNVPEVIAAKTKGRVQVFSLDGAAGSTGPADSSGAVDVAPVQAVPASGGLRTDGGIPVPSDPNVQVFPLR
jgi:hypothetical protein